MSEAASRDNSDDSGSREEEGTGKFEQAEQNGEYKEYNDETQKAMSSAAKIFHVILDHKRMTLEDESEKKKKLENLFKRITEINMDETASPNIQRKRTNDGEIPDTFFDKAKVDEEKAKHSSDDESSEESSEANGQAYLHAIEEVIFKQKDASEDDQLSKLHQVMYGCTRLELSSSYTLDPITRNDIRKVNFELLKQHFPQTYKKEDFFRDQFIKLQPKNLLFLLEMGLMWDKDKLLEKYLQELLIGEGSIKTFLNEIAYANSMDSSEDEEVVDMSKLRNEARTHAPKINQMLEVIVHCLLYRNDRAVENRFFKNHPKSKFMLVFEDQKVCTWITRGIVELLSEDNISTYFSDSQVKGHINTILTMMLSIESDKSLANVEHLNTENYPLDPEQFSELQVSADVSRIKKEISRIVKNMVKHNYPVTSQDEIPANLLTDIRDLQILFERCLSNDHFALRMAAIYDLPRMMLWLNLALMAYYSFDAVDEITKSLCSHLEDWVKTSRFVSDSFFSRRNWQLYEVLLEIKPTHFLPVMMHNCSDYMSRDSEFLAMVMPPLIHHLVKALRFLDDGEKLMATYEDIIQWMHCIQCFIDLTSSLTEGRSGTDSKNMQTVIKTCTKIELILKNLIGPRISFIFDKFKDEDRVIQDIIDRVEGWPYKEEKQTYKPLLISSDYFELAENTMLLINNWPTTDHFIKMKIGNRLGSTTHARNDQPSILLLELYCYLLRLFNKVIKYSEMAGFQFVMTKELNSSPLEQVLGKLDYLRGVRHGYMFLTEFHAIYSNLFLIDLPDASLFPCRALFTNQNLASQENRDENEAESINPNVAKGLLDFVTSDVNLKKRMEALYELTRSLGILEIEEYNMFPEEHLRPIKGLAKSTRSLKEYFNDKSEQLEDMIQQINQFQGDMMNKSMQLLYTRYMRKSLFRLIYRFICAAIYIMPAESFSEIGIFRVIEAFIDNLAIIGRFCNAEIKVDVSDVKFYLANIRNKSGKANLAALNSLTNEVSSTIDQLKFVIVERFKETLERIYTEYLGGMQSELMAISRDSFKQLNQTPSNKLYAHLKLKENTALRILSQGINLQGKESEQSESDNLVKASVEDQIERLKLESLTEKGEFIGVLLKGSEYSISSYFENITNWVVMHLESITNKSELYPGCNMILYSETFTLFHMLDNLMIHNQGIRTKIINQHEATQDSKKEDDSASDRKSILVYFIDALAHSQRNITSSVFSSNILLEIELCMLYCGFLKGLTQNNSERAKILIAATKMADFDGRTALEEIIGNLVIDCRQEPVNSITVHDRADLVWYNIVCLGFLTECLSGPCKENQDLLEEKLHGKYLDFLQFCRRQIDSLDNPFYQLQSCVSKFLLAVFEGPNLETIKRLNDMKPDVLYKVITSHLLNMWQFYSGDRPVQDSPVALQQNEYSNVAEKNDLGTDSILQAVMSQSIGKQQSSILGEPAKQTEKQQQRIPNLESLMTLYKTDQRFATNCAIVLARTVYLIMSYAESSGLRRYTQFLEEKRNEQKSIMNNISKKSSLDSDTEVKSMSSRSVEVIENIKKKIFKNKNAADKNPFVKDKQEKEMLLLLFVFLNEITGTIEITTKDNKTGIEKQVRVVFPILPECHFFSKSKLDRFIEKCSVNNQNERLLELIGFSEEIMVTIKGNMAQFKSSKTLSKLVTFEAINIVLYIAWGISLAMNVVWLISADIDKSPFYSVSIYERFDTIAVPNPQAQLVLFLLSLFLGLFCFFYLVGWLLFRYPITLETNRLGRARIKQREGPLQRLWRSIDLYCWSSLIAKGQPTLLACHIIFVFLYYYVASIFITFHLLLFVYHFETTRFIIKSVTTHFRKFITSLVYICFCVLCASTIIGYHYKTDLNEDFVTKGVTDWWVSSFAYVLDYGLQAGGGFGDYMVVLPASNYFFFEKAVLVISFFLLIKIVFQNIMLGIIVDTFMELRGNQTEHSNFELHRQHRRERMLHLRIQQNRVREERQIFQPSRRERTQVVGLPVLHDLPQNQEPGRIQRHRTVRLQFAC